MKVSRGAWNTSVNYRSLYISQVQKYYDNSPSQLSSILTNVARDAGYTTRDKPITGGALISYAKSGDAPLWLCRAALDMILTQGYLPDTDDEWIALVSILVLDEEEFLSLKFISALPKQINKSAFKEWLLICQY